MNVQVNTLIEVDEDDDIGIVKPFYVEEMMAHAIHKKYWGKYPNTNKIRFGNGYVLIDTEPMDFEPDYKLIGAKGKPAITFEQNTRTYQYYMQDGVIHAEMTPSLLISNYNEEVIKEEYYLDGANITLEEMLKYVAKSNIGKF